MKGLCGRTHPKGSGQQPFKFAPERFKETVSPTMASMEVLSFTFSIESLIFQCFLKVVKTADL